MDDLVRAGVAAAVRAEAPLLAGALRDDVPEADGAGFYPVLIEAVREGQRLHAHGGRVVDSSDPDLALLAGDRLYALGLARLADRGDLLGVAVLADAISACARGQAEGRAEAADDAWRAAERAMRHAAQEGASGR